MKTKQISLMEYSQKINPTHFRANRKFPNQQITQQAIKYRIKNGLPLPEVVKYNRVGKIHVITVLANF
jgi:hypothetical protein|tara:strand:+ start:4411 stop:4614 length:204 start_codon:yes stop_codon:yes gene_type:complete